MRPAQRRALAEKAVATQSIALTCIQPCKPRQNTCVERDNRVRHWARTNGAFNGSRRHEWLDLYILETIKKVQQIAPEWLWTCNNERPNMSIGGVTPATTLKMPA